MLPPAFPRCLPAVAPCPLRVGRAEPSAPAPGPFHALFPPPAVLPLFFHPGTRPFSSGPALPSRQSCQHLMGRAGGTSLRGSGVPGPRQHLGGGSATELTLHLPLGSERLEGRPRFLLTPQLSVLITGPGTWYRCIEGVCCPHLANHGEGGPRAQ